MSLDTLLPPGFDRQSLPEGVPEHVVELRSGAEIIAAIERS